MEQDFFIVGVILYLVSITLFTITAFQRESKPGKEIYVINAGDNKKIIKVYKEKSNKEQQINIIVYNSSNDQNSGFLNGSRLEREIFKRKLPNDY